MIFFTVGTERFPFDRLMEMADKVHEVSGEAVKVQFGESRVIPQKCDSLKSLPYLEFVQSLTSARIIVTHAGVGAIVSCARLGKVPIVMPRRKEFGEHVDDHQVELAVKMNELGYVLLAETGKDILRLIQNYNNEPVVQRRQQSALPGLAGSLSAYLSEIKK